MAKYKFVAEAEAYFKEHPEKLRMCDILVDLGISQIQKEVYMMGARGVPIELIKAHADKRVKELKTTLGIET